LYVAATGFYEELMKWHLHSNLLKKIVQFASALVVTAERTPTIISFIAATRLGKSLAIDMWERINKASSCGLSMKATLAH
jgi:hypothetical protein